MHAKAACRALAFTALLAASCGKANPMIRQVPDSRSLVLRATHITHIMVESLTAPEWGEDQVRTAQLSLVLLQPFKGELIPATGRVQISVPQHRPVLLGDIPPPQGCWPDQPLLPGQQFLAFSITREKDAAAVLSEGACRHLEPADTSLVDVRLAAKIENESSGLEAIAAMVKPAVSDLHELFFEYLGERFRELNLEERKNYESVMELLENRALASAPRLVLLDAVRRHLEASQTVAPYHFHRLAIAMFRLLTIPEAQALHENLIGTYLPDIINLTDSDQPRSASAVFWEWSNDRLAAQRALASYQDQSAAAPLLEWIKATR